MGENELFTNYNQCAKCLAQDLLGKVICYKDKEGNETRYMITVTEAYPANDPYSYVNTYTSGFGHNCLVSNEQKKELKGYKDEIDNEPGKCFIVSNMMHILGQKSKDLNGKPAFDHVLVRGGIKIDDSGSLVIESPKINLVIGEPITLSNKLLKTEQKDSITYTYNLTDTATLSPRLSIRIDEQFNGTKKTFESERYNLPIPREIKNSDDKNKYDDIPRYIDRLRFFFIPDKNWFIEKENE